MPSRLLADHLGIEKIIVDENKFLSDSLVVDDIFDQGHTLEAVCNFLKDKGAKEVLSAVVINKLHDRKVAFRPDFIGLEIEDRFLYGFGMDYKGYLRNANGIYAVKGL
mgnify:CR=1 FL=1